MRINKWLAMNFLALGAAAMFAPAAAAQSQQGQTATGMEEPQPMTGQEMHATGLSDEQKGKIKDINKARHGQIQAIRNDSSLTNEQRAAKIRDINRGSGGQIRGLLSLEQQKRFDRRVQKRHHAAKQRHQQRKHRRNRV